MSAPLRVNFVLHAAGKTGGVLVVLEYARRLREMGHDTRVYHPALPYAVYYEGYPAWKRPLARLYALARNLWTARAAHRAAKGVDMRLLPRVSAAFVRDADVTLATAWPTAYDVAALPASKGRKMYFIQGYEVWNGRAAEVDASYRLPLDLLTIAPWLTQLMREKFGREPAAELRNGVDLDFFSAPTEKTAGPLTILMMYHQQAVKGVPDGLYAVRGLRERQPGIRVLMFGMYPFVDKDPFIEYHRDPSRALLRSLYQEAHVFVSPGLSEGWQLPPMEAMACGCAVVATRVGCIPALDSGDNMLTVEPGDREGLLAALEALSREPTRLREIATRGRITIQEYGWNRKAREFEAFLERSTTPS